MSNKLNTFTKSAIVAGTVLISFASTLILEPIAQDLKYHLFADQRIILGIPGFVNVVSSFFISAVGVYCLTRYRKNIQQNNNAGYAFYIFYIGMILTGFGSAYYHLSPDNYSLMWDRLAMTISFMAFFTYLISEHISRKLGLVLLWPLLALGIFSVTYWRYTEGLGAGDLRLYGLVQFLPIVLTPLFLFLYPSESYKQKYIWIMITLYVTAKVAEYFDLFIFEYFIYFSGHTLKHVLAALAGIMLLKIELSKNTK